MRASRLIAIGVVAFAASSGCKSRSSSGGTAMRLSPVQVWTDQRLDAVQLVDRDATTKVQVRTATNVFLRLARPVSGAKVKVQDARSLRVTAEGMGALGPPDDGGWAAADIESESALIVLHLEPEGADAEVAEIEIWGAGETRASVDPAALAAATLATNPISAAAGTAAPRWLGDDVVAVPAAAAGQVKLEPRGTAEGADCMSTRFEAGALVLGARRAYLAYEANLHRAIELRRSIGAAAPVGGFWLGTSPRATLVDEVDPERLTGSDAVLLCLPIEATSAVTIEGLRLVLVLDRGANGFDRDAELAIAAALDGNTATAWDAPASRVELGLDRLTAIEEASIRTTGSASLHSVGTSDGNAWSEQGAVILAEGSTTLELGGRVARALELTFEGAAGAPAARVAELSVTGSGAGPGIAANRLVISYPRLSLEAGRLIGERFGGEAYVAGWAESPAGPGAVEVEGARMDVGGAFGVPLRRASDATAGWTVTLRARFPDGGEIVKVVHLDDDRGAEIEPPESSTSATDDGRFGAENATAWGVLRSSGGTLSLGTDVSLEAPEHAVGSDTSIGIARKGHEVVPKLDAGMINVTAPARFAYRFLPAGQRFAKPVKIAIPYDPELLPEGMVPEEIQTYYYDRDEARWLTLPRTEVRRDTRQIVSETTHFTFMINAVLVLPEHPGPVSFNPNSIKDLKAADPSAGIDLVEAPDGNGQGTANVSFPIRLPKGRGAYQPSLALTYGSGGANGWLGVGWELPVSSISIDTRYGVPIYDGEERYVLDGAQLVPVALGAPCTDGSPGRGYMARVERDFRRIVRCGTGTTSYWFEVTDKGGTLYVYGKDSTRNSRLTSYAPHLYAIPRYPPAYDIGQWFLERVVDTNGNLTRFVYQHDNRDNLSDRRFNEDFRQVYLSDIFYTGRSGRADASFVSDGPYHVQLTHLADVRTDLVTSGRLGFKVVTRKLLGSIKVELNGARIREYVLDYEEGDFDKSRLTSVTTRAADGATFYTHGFEYTSKTPRTGRVAAFRSAVATWAPGGEDEKALTSSEDKGFGGHAFVGISVFQPKDSGTVGFALDFNERTSKTKATFLDVNGDNLPDRMFRDGGAWLSRPASDSLGAALTPLPRPGDPVLPANGPAFMLGQNQSLGSETSNTFTGAVQIMGFGLGGNFGGSYMTTRARDLVLDANGDGLPDLVTDGQIWFNQPLCTGLSPERACFQRGIPAPVLQDPQIPIDLAADDPASHGTASDARRDALSPQDVVVEWTAPFQGVVDVTGAIRFVDDVLREGRHDGVRLRIFYAAPPWVDWEALQVHSISWAQVGADVVKFPDDAGATDVAHRVSVYQGDTLYFVLSTLSDFPIGLRPDGTTRYSPEQVGFAPVVTYIFTGPGEDLVDEQRRAEVDPTGAPLYRYDLEADLRLAGNQQLSVTIPRDGNLRITSILQKYPTSDDLVACARLFAPGEYDPADTGCGASVSTGTPIRLALPSYESSTRRPSLEQHVLAGSTLVFWVKSSMPIDPAAVDWTIDGEMTCLDQGGTCRPLAADDPVRATLRFRATPNLPVHSPAVPPQSPIGAWLPDGRNPVPFVPPVDGTLHVTVSGSLYWNSDWPDWYKQWLYWNVYVPFPTHFAVRSPAKLHASWTLPQGLWFSRTLAIPVERGVPVFFDAHEELGYGGTSYTLSNIRFEYQEDGATVSVPVSGEGTPSPLVTMCATGHSYRLGNRPILGGGYHGWRYGVWQGRNDEAFLPWVYRTPQMDQFPHYPDEDEDDPDVLKPFYKAVLPPIMRNREERERQRARLLGILAPSADGTRRNGEPGLLPGVPGWVSPDANAFLVAGRMNAARRGARVNGRNDDSTIQANAWFAGSGRSSVATTLTAGISLGGVLSLSVSSGMSHQDQDLVDLNGDRIPDVIQAGSVPDVSDLDGSGLSSFLGGGHTSQARITDNAELTPRNLVSVPVQPRLNVDLSGQAGLGLTEAVKLLASKNRVNGVAGRMPNLSLGVGVGVGVNVATTVEDLVDVNGDGLPDAVRKNDACGGFSVRLNLGNAFARGEDCLGTYGWGANVLSDLAHQLDPTGVTNEDGGEDTDTGVGVATSMLGRLRDASALRQVSTVTLQGDVGGAVDDTESFGASVSSESSLSATNVALVDVTGDGLPDFVAKGNDAGDFRVSVNLGYGFAQPQSWSAPAWPAGSKPNFRAGAGSTATLEGLLTGFWSQASGGIDPVEATGTHTDLPSTSFVFTVAFPIAPPLPSPWMQLSFGANATLGRTTGFELGLQDIDGDGFADHVLKTSESSSVLARVNQLGGGNLLKRVTRPLRGSFDLEYTRVGNTVEMPESVYALTRVTVHDGVATGTGHDIATRYEYAGGKYNRNEREFMGFQTVTRRNADETKLVRTFLNGDFRYKGLLESELVLDSQDRKYVETVNAYLAEIAVGGEPQSACVARTPINLKYGDDLYCASSFTRLLATEKRVYEGGEQALVSSRQSFVEYDDSGNVTKFHDWSDLADPNDDVWATVSYGPTAAAAFYCAGAPTEIVVTAVEDDLTNPLRKRNASYDARCNMTQLRSLVSGATEAVADLEWYPAGHVWAGNLRKVTSPLNHRDQRYYVEYEYDGVIAAHVTKTTDVHGYVSEARYDYALGENVWTKDVNGQETLRQLDGFGRLWKVAAPGFTLTSPTIEITYTPAATVPRALTKNKLPRGGTLDTVVLMDGIGRVIQTKKTAEIWTGSLESTRVGWAVTGHQRFDVMGRVAEQGQTFFDANLGAAYSPGSPRNPTRLLYDVLGRTVQTVEPNGAVTRILFGFGTPAETSLTRHKTTAVDPLGKVRVVYQDGSERNVEVEEHVEGRTPTTHYAYDRLGQLVTVTDAAGNQTTAQYDLLGRRTVLDNPDTGATSFVFDRAGNLVSRHDARGLETTYVYDFERLKEIHYPTTTRNVVYEYGPPHAPENAAGRITSVDDEVGIETRGYDALGNLARSTRTVDPLRPGDRPREYTTTFQLDVYGRMLSMVYPDGEALTYLYDAGGLLRYAKGTRPATSHDPAQTETYLAKLLYDEFGQRRYQRVGNGVVTKYDYELLTRRLSWLHAQKPGERLLQNLVYEYDLVGNVLGVQNALGAPVPPHAGTVDFEYRYDDLHRLVWAHGEARSRPRTTDTFTSTFAYSDIHNMLTNVQVHHVLHGGGGGEYPPHTNHDFSYQYTGTGPHQATRIGDTSLVYDAAGNTLRECRDPADPTCTERPSHLRRYEWTEENRLSAVIDGGGRNATTFFYDADGERIAKLGRGGESITIGQFWALKGRRAATKHVFAGTTRIASKLLPPPGWDDVPRDPADAPAPSPPPPTDESGCRPSNYQPQKCPQLEGGEPVLNDYYAYAKVRPETYYYHPDHLGSTSWVTDQNARVHEHVEYFPYGAVWRDPRSDVGASPVKGQRFLFTGKELDEETGLYYFGARYYDPVRVRWASADPALTGGAYFPDLLNPEHVREGFDPLRELPASGGAYNPLNVALYSYAHHNPVKLTDPDGDFPFLVVTAAIGAVAGGVAGAIISYKQTGEVSFNAVVAGVAGGAALGLGIGTVAGVFAGASLTTSTTAVVAGLKTAAMVAGGTAGGTAVAGKVVLGRSPYYLQVARQIGGRALQVPGEVWNKMSGAQQWIMNRRFLDQAIKAGEEFVLATRPDLAPRGSFYAREIAYLLSRGYQYAADGMRLIPPSPGG